MDVIIHSCQTHVGCVCAKRKKQPKTNRRGVCATITNLTLLWERFSSSLGSERPGETRMWRKIKQSLHFSKSLLYILYIELSDSEIKQTSQSIEIFTLTPPNIRIQVLSLISLRGGQDLSESETCGNICC